MWSLIFPGGESMLLHMLVLALSSKRRNVLFESLNTSCLLIFHWLNHPLAWMISKARFREEKIDCILDWKTCKVIYKEIWIRGGECFVTNLQPTTWSNDDNLSFEFIQHTGFLIQMLSMVLSFKVMEVASNTGKKILVVSGKHHLLSCTILISWHLLNHCLSVASPTLCMLLWDPGGRSPANYIFALPVHSLLSSDNSDH